MPRKALSKSRKSKSRDVKSSAARRKTKPAPRRVVLKSSSWYASAARAIAISGATRTELQEGR